MKILYGVQATGTGHISQAKQIVPQLRKRHDVDVVISGPQPTIDISELAPYQHFTGISHQHIKGKMNFSHTAVKALQHIPRLYYDAITYQKKSYDLVFCDYEPITARIAQYRHIPCVGFSHLYSFDYKLPIHNTTRPLSTFWLKQFAPAQYPLGLHWHPFAQPLLPPLISPHLSLNTPMTNRKVLVYLPMESLAEVIAWLQPLTDYEFLIFHPDVTQPAHRDHLELSPLCWQGFQHAFLQVSYLMTNSGFGVIAEGLAGGKKILTKPLLNNIEQENNAVALEYLQWGQATRVLTTDSIGEWLTAAKPIKPQAFFNYVDTLIEWLEAKNWGDIAGLSTQLWKKVNAHS